MNSPTTSERVALITRNTAEVLGASELPALLEGGAPLRHYIGFEISGRVHLGGGLLTMGKVRDFMAAGIDCRVFLADWHTWINDKLGGDRDTIRRVATGYFAEAMRAALACVGGDPERLTTVLASELYDRTPDYWATVIEVSKHTSLARMQRSISIMGRGEGDTVDFAKLVYPAMQAADIYAQGVTIAHAGLDQRKAHVIARDVALQLRIAPLRDGAGGTVKPVAVHHPLILGLAKPPVWPVPPDQQRELLSAQKMSKSKAGSAVFLDDAPDDIRRKVQRAFCPPGDEPLNPILNWVEHLVFGLGDSELRIDRSEAHGGPMTLHTHREVVDAYASGSLHPMDLKGALAARLIDRLEPARTRLGKPEVAAVRAEIDALGAG